MPKEGEIGYLRAMGEAGRRHAAAKPFDDDACPQYLEDIAAVMRLLPKPPARLLDLGCGSGWTSAFFARRGYTVVGVDIAPAMLELGNAVRLREELANLTFIEADYESFVAEAPFDAVVFFDALHHAEEPERAVRCAFDALRPGGVCITHEPGAGHAESETSRHAVQAFGVTEIDMPPERVIALGVKAGFQQFYAFPLPGEIRVADYRLHEESRVSAGRARIGPPGPLESAGLAKRLFHSVVRRRLRFTAPAYAGFMAHLPKVQQACERTDWRVLSHIGAIVAMVK